MTEKSKCYLEGNIRVGAKSEYRGFDSEFSTSSYISTTNCIDTGSSTPWNPFLTPFHVIDFLFLPAMMAEFLATEQATSTTVGTLNDNSLSETNSMLESAPTEGKAAEDRDGSFVVSNAKACQLLFLNLCRALHCPLGPHYRK